MHPADLTTFLDTLIDHQVKLSTMIWGPPGIGKSSIVAQVAARHGLACIDLRLSQLAPTDLRGLPVAESGRSRWYPPEFLPTEGAGVLFLDEINMAPPTMQGMAQQLILDRQVGSYRVPEGWFIWAVGNRDEDRAAVFEMPAPLANRFIHVEVAPDFENCSYALNRGLHEHIIAFLSFRPALLHKSEPLQSAWPSPRSWEMASTLHQHRPRHRRGGGHCRWPTSSPPLWACMPTCPTSTRSWRGTATRSASPTGRRCATPPRSG